MKNYMILGLLLFGCATAPIKPKPNPKTERVQRICEAICASMGWKLAGIEVETRTCTCDTRD